MQKKSFFVFFFKNKKDWNGKLERAQKKHFYQWRRVYVRENKNNVCPTLTANSDGEIFKAKVFQENSKALMTNPNKALSDWLLRKVLQLKEGELATIEKLDKLGFDSVIITKKQNSKFEIDILKSNSYENFCNN